MSNRTTQNEDVRALVLLLASAGVIILGCLALNGFTWVRLQKSAARQSMALDSLGQYSTVLSTLQDIELGQRGYVISGDEYHLEVFDSSREKFAEEWQRLTFLEAKDGRSKMELKEIRDASDNLVKSAIEIVFVRKNMGAQDAEKLFMEGKQKQTMRRVRSLYKERMKEVQMLIRKRNTAAENDFQAGLATSMAMGLLALGIGAISLLLLRRVLKEIKRSERYAQSMLKAEEARRQKDVFLAMMSHEIRTPLNAIIGFGQLAQQEEMADKPKRYVKSILEGGQSLLLLINDILDLSKLQAGRMELKLEPTRIKDLLRFMERLFQETCSGKGVGFSLDIQDDIPESLVLDSVRLRQVLMNLIGNAVKFTDRGEVAVKVSGAAIEANSSLWDLEIIVSDTGPGIPEVEIKHIFEPFYQSNEASATVSKGTGLGLSIVQRFIKLMNGELSVTSELGHGTQFTVRLKNLHVSARVGPDQFLPSTQVDFNRLKPSKILAVDDNETNRELLMEIFSSSHHEILTACDGDDAVRKIRESKPDLVLMDLRMPVKDGSTAAREIKLDMAFRYTPIIAVTAGSLPTKSDDMQLGPDFDGALRKPFTRQEIFDALAQFLKAVHLEPETSSNEVTSVPERVSKQLLGELRILLTDQWPGVKSAMIISKIVKFSQELDVLSGQESCSRLDTYSQRLKEAAESFSFGEMETVLGRFPDLVAELEESKS